MSDAEKRSADFADSVMRQLTESGISTDDGAVFSLTPEMMFQAMQDAGDCWICGEHKCLVHSVAIQRAAFNAERENMGKPMRFHIKST